MLGYIKDSQGSERRHNCPDMTVSGHNGAPENRHVLPAARPRLITPWVLVTLPTENLGSLTFSLPERRQKKNSSTKDEKGQ